MTAFPSCLYRHSFGSSQWKTSSSLFILLFPCFQSPPQQRPCPSGHPAGRQRYLIPTGRIIGNKEAADDVSGGPFGRIIWLPFQKWDRWRRRNENSVADFVFNRGIGNIEVLTFSFAFFAIFVIPSQFVDYVYRICIRCARSRVSRKDNAFTRVSEWLCTYRLVCLCFVKHNLERIRDTSHGNPHVKCKDVR